jgi:hypothetical protein
MSGRVVGCERLISGKKFDGSNGSCSGMTRRGIKETGWRGRIY